MDVEDLLYTWDDPGVSDRCVGGWEMCGRGVFAWCVMEAECVGGEAFA